MRAIAFKRSILPMIVGCTCLACTSPEERARTTCQAEVKKHLFHPEAAVFDHVQIERSDEGGWRIALEVKAPTVGGEASSSSVVCLLSSKLELLDLSGEARPHE